MIFLTNKFALPPDSQSYLANTHVHTYTFPNHTHRVNPCLQANFIPSNLQCLVHSQRGPTLPENTGHFSLADLPSSLPL
jgi:hypothetical protein